MKKATAPWIQSYGCCLPALTRFDEYSRDGEKIIPLALSKQKVFTPFSAVQDRP